MKSSQNTEFKNFQDENIDTVCLHKGDDSIAHCDQMTQLAGNSDQMTQLAGNSEPVDQMTQLAGNSEQVEDDDFIARCDQMAGSSHQVEETKPIATAGPSNQVTTTDPTLQNLNNDKSVESTIFVGNLPYKVNWQNLKAFFSKFGSVTYATIVKDSVTNKPKGYGFIQFSNCEESHAALSATPEELCFFGRTLRINLARNTSSRRHTRQVVTDGSCQLFQQMAFQETDSAIARLTDDSLVHVFDYLTPLELMNVEGVCKRWQRCALVAARQRKCMTLNRQSKCLLSTQGDGFYDLLSRCCHLVSLDISSVAMLLSKIDPLKVIATFGKHIEILNVSGAESGNRSLGVLARECTHLKSLTVEHCSKISEKGFQSLFKFCRQLEHLDCTGNTEFTGKCLTHATSAFISLHASHCVRLTKKGILNLVKKCPLMQTLKLEKCPQLLPQTISQLAKSLPGLKILFLGNVQSQERPGNSADHFVQHFVNPGIIVKLQLYNCSMVDSNLQSICTNCPLISYLDISCNVLTDTSVIQLAALKHLEYLSACNLSHITDMALVDVARQGRLRKLLVQGCYRLTDRLMQIVAENCLQIEELDVAGIPSISMVSLTCFREACLRRVSVSQLHIYTAVNDFDQSTVEEYSNPPNLYIYDNYRTLYPHLVSWLPGGDELDLAGNPVFPNPDQNYRVQMLAADLVGFDEYSDDDFVYRDDDDDFADEFLDNDDFLAQERWNLS
ncbi:hypothetical protein BsWGS_21962 [Bradybaena similaris]